MQSSETSWEGFENLSNMYTSYEPAIIFPGKTKEIMQAYKYVEMATERVLAIKKKLSVTCKNF